ncbi:hypothetical protein I350_02372 [Cryptococcus amylolentus CBS 6273]|uniref:BZIP domain-containing protein n=1 Tax=Cryptococcus amylolentus CBS 6273 TaxID=1296118 RepID=A0A1E3KAF5_9TREE|nr:hypothetical protein I350_02372 [Cryptococcus amylolentus CBS 6273]
MSVAVSTPTPTIMSKPAAPRLQSRPSISSATSANPSRPMAPKPPSRPPLNPNASASSSSSRVAVKSSSAAVPAPAPRPAPASRANSSASGSVPIGVSPAPGKDTSSSAGKIFAKPSKEWVLPERAKPGRKKRQSQNRLSQRAHRARRTDYIQTLEERLRQYEADEIHSNVRLQEVARALKADNERLKSEVNELHSKYMEASSEKEIWEMERRTLKEALRDMRTEVESVRAGRGMETIVRMDIDQHTIDRLVPGPTLSRRQSNVNQLASGSSHDHRGLQDCPICPNPDPDCACQQPHHHQHQQNYPPEHLTLVPSAADDHAAACGFCHSNDECLCRAVEEDVKPDISSPSHDFQTEDDGCGLCTGGDFCACKEAAAAAASTNFLIGSSKSPKDTSAATGVFKASTTAAAMPLRLRGKASGASKASVWSLNPVPESPREAVCTGDPSNCDACRDDSFGREFCQHLFETGKHDDCTRCNSQKAKKSGPTLPPSPDITQASNSSSGQGRTPPTPPSHSHMTMSMSMMSDDTPLAPLQMACCGNPELCGGSRSGACTGDVIGIGGPGGALGMSMTEQEIPEVRHEPRAVHHNTLRPDQVWKQLKAHPNAKFASLALLADVVARRTKCLDGSDEMSPMPGSPALTNGTPGPSGSFSHHGSPTPPLSRGPMLGSPSVGPSMSPAPGPGMSGLSGLPSHMKKRNIEVETSAVRDALKMLDEATPAPSPSPERELKRRRI